jgi:hypothetical protein
MKVFLSYPSVRRDLAERLELALEAEGHEVFMDRSELKAGEAFHQRLREAIQAADAMVFVVTPESVAPGSYALAELEIARQRWRRPGGHVLPVMASPTPIAALPAYLSAVTVLQPRGEIVAETVAAVAHLAAAVGGRGRRFALVAVALIAAVAVLAILGQRRSGQHAAEQARLEAQSRDTARAAQARQLCDDGSHSAAMAQLDALAGRESAPAEVLRAREDCAMSWLRGMSAIEGRSTFDAQVTRLEPVLVQALGSARGEHAADLRAHLGWGEYLRRREGAAFADPVVHWQRALGDDPANVYAHAMWARHLLDRPGGLPEAKVHFAQALAGDRDRAYVRALQLGGSVGGSIERTAYALTVVDEMRRTGEVVDERHRSRLWGYAFGSSMLAPADRAVLLAALPAADLLATFNALYPAANVAEDRRPLWRFAHATLLAAAGDRQAARAGFDSLVRELRAGRHAGRLLDESQRALDRLGPATGAKTAR